MSSESRNDQHFDSVVARGMCARNPTVCKRFPTVHVDAPRATLLGSLHSAILLLQFVDLVLRGRGYKNIYLTAVANIDVSSPIYAAIFRNDHPAS